ncbi:sensor histidine kinase [Actinomadura gamaensis]|uniref:Histidine kinase n=1 Tax=Actinomadura gamaensis TaxID=1763541 RepID=A0ABV9U399_9ACTN
MERIPDDLPPRPVRGMLWASLAILFAIRAASGIDNGWGALGVVLATTSYPPLIALLALCRGPRVRYSLLACVVALYLVPFPILGLQWDWMPWTVAAALLHALPTRWAWSLFTLVVAVTGLIVLLDGGNIATGVSRMVIVADDGLIVFSMAALVRTIERLASTREELARSALARERLRLDDELRDALGGRLQAIAFRLRNASPIRPPDDSRDAAGLARDHSRETTGRALDDLREAPGHAQDDLPEAAELARNDHGEETASAGEDLREATDLARRALGDVRATAAAYRAVPFSEEPLPLGSPRPARRVLLAVLVIQCVLVLANISLYDDLGLGHLSPEMLALGVLALCAIVILQTLPRTRLVFAVQSLLIVLPVFLLTTAWDRLLSFFSGALLLRVRRPFSWMLVGAVLAVHFALLRRETESSLTSDLAALGGHVMLMWLVYALERLSELAAVLERARHDLADRAVRRERTRVARDLHDVLGYSLSAVALKGELAERLLDTAPDRARAEIAALTALVERSMAELDAIVVDRVRLTLAAEIGAARRMLESAGITTGTDVEHRPLPPELDTALAAVLRETVTNVLRHSRARTCEITISQDGDIVRLHVVNDGATPDTADRPARETSPNADDARPRPTPTAADPRSRPAPATTDPASGLAPVTAGLSFGPASDTANPTSILAMGTASLESGPASDTAGPASGLATDTASLESGLGLGVAGPGSGLVNLAQRTGGGLVARRRPGGLFEVVAEFRSDPAGLGRDPDGVDPVPGVQLDGR